MAGNDSKIDVPTGPGEFKKEPIWEYLERELGLYTSLLWRDIGILIVFAVVFRVGAMLAVKYLNF